MKPEELLRKIAEEHGLDFVNLNEVAIPLSVVELIPESVARENVVLALAEDKDRRTVKVIVSDPLDYDTRERLRFILQRNIEIALATRDSILESINKHYGQIDGSHYY